MPRATREVAVMIRFNPRAGRRGGAYVFFLGTALLVTVIGMSALTVARVQMRSVVGADDAAAAELYARSAIEQALLIIYKDPSWRDKEPHDTWSAKQFIGRGWFSWKLVDETKGSLTADRNAPVRVFGQGICGDAVRVYSVLVQPPLVGKPGNSLMNGGLELGVATPWAQRDGCVLQVISWEQHTGAYSLLVTGRSPGSSAAQPLSGLTNGGSCQVSVWAKLNGGSQDVWAVVDVQSGSGWQSFEAGRVSVGSSWTEISGVVTPTWDGALVQAVLAVGTDGTSEFTIDDASAVVAPEPVGVIAGSWRRESQ